VPAYTLSGRDFCPILHREPTWRPYRLALACIGCGDFWHRPGKRDGSEPHREWMGIAALLAQLREQAGSKCLACSPFVRYTLMMKRPRPIRQSLRRRGRVCPACAQRFVIARKSGTRNVCERCVCLREVSLLFKLEDSVWWVHFLKPDSQLPLAPPQRFRTAEGVRALARKSPTRWSLLDSCAFESGIRVGEGRIRIFFSPDQLEALREGFPIMSWRP
jgi:hypothetical protein